MTIKPLILLLTTLLLAGCGGSATKQQNKDFFTSGNKEADQRADQRMVKSQQLRGEGAGKAGDSKSPNSNEKAPLYERLGGADGVAAIVDDFTTRLLADPQVNFTRNGVKQGGFSIHRGKSVAWDPSPANVAQLKKHIVQFIALKTGGPVHYDGKGLQSAHAGMHVTNTEFDAAVGDLKATLDKLRTPNQEQKELLSLIEATRPQIAEER